MRRSGDGGSGSRIRTAPTVVLIVAISVVLAGCGSTGGGTGTWSIPVTVATRAPLVSVSCPTTSSCVAIDEQGRLVSLVRGVWSSGSAIPGAGASADSQVGISCVAVTWCQATLGNGAMALFHGSAWTTFGVVDKSGDIVSLSCPTTRFCAAVDDNGKALIYRGTWSPPVAVDSGGQLQDVSCTDSIFCMAVSADTPGTAYRFNGTQWSAVPAPNPSTPQGGSEPNTLSAVSCASSTSCEALDDFGEAFEWDGRSWSNPVTFDNQMQDGDDAVSCPAKGFCMVVDDNGIAVPILDGSPGSSRQLDSSSFGLNDVSCASAAWCVAIGGPSRVYTYRASTNAS
jgi:hypothetical protein